MYEIHTAGKKEVRFQIIDGKQLFPTVLKIKNLPAGMDSVNIDFIE